MFLKLDNQNYLRKGRALSHDDRQMLAYIWNTTSFFAQALNYLTSLFAPKNPHRKTQVNNLGKFGMTEDHLTSLWCQSMIANFLANIESIFRFTLIFFLDEKFFRDVKCEAKFMTTNRLLKELKRIYPQAKDFDEAFDLNLRNSIAHGAFWFESDKWHLTSDPHFKNIKLLTLADLMMLAIKADVGAKAFIDALNNERKKGTFRA